LIRTLIPSIDLRDLRRALADDAPLHLDAHTWREREDLSKPAPVGEFQI
jgi:hypothetical protein